MRASSSLLCSLLLLGCGPETGILITVSGQAVDELEFQIAVGRGDQFVIDSTISGERRPLQGRDLRVDPYELLLREDRTGEEVEREPPAVRVLALGYRAGKLTSLALLEPPQAFLRGELLRRTLLLLAVGSGTGASPSGKGCYAVQVKDRSYKLVTDGDADCDGFGPADSPADCNDADASVHPGAKEVCDGKDNDCDGKLLAAPEACYQEDTFGVCRQGTRACAEASGGGLAAGCLTDGGAESRSPYCFVYAGCRDSKAPLLCLADRLSSISYSCRLEVVDGIGSCGATRDLYPPFPGKGCRWSLVSSGELPISLEPPVPGSCTSKLVVAAGAPVSAGTVALEYYEEESRRAALFSALIEPRLVQSCSAEPISCVKR